MHQISPDRAVIFSVDVITPLVDDPKLYGAISAANALSDIYAMGGEGMMSLSVLGAPGDFPVDVLTEILRGAAETALAAGAPILGGHSIESKDLLFGLAVVGTAHPDQLFRNDGLRPGDQLVLTQALGTGTLTTALKRDHLTEAELQPAFDAMARLNAAAVEPLRRHGVRAATDITGFGLLGHAAEMAKGSGVQVVFDQALVPELPRAREMMAAGVVTRGNGRNRAYVEDLGPLEGDPEPLVLDPQTSGGLLAAVSPEALPAVLDELRSCGYPEAARVGEIREGRGIHVR